MLRRNKEEEEEEGDEEEEEEEERKGVETMSGSDEAAAAGGGGEGGKGGGKGGGVGQMSGAQDVERMHVFELMRLAMTNVEDGEAIPAPPRWLVEWSSRSMQGVSVGIAAGALHHAATLPQLDAAHPTVYMKRALGVSQAAMRGGLLVGTFAAGYCALKHFFVQQIWQRDDVLQQRFTNDVSSSVHMVDASDVKPSISAQRGDERGIEVLEDKSEQRGRIFRAVTSSSAAGFVMGCMYGGILLAVRTSNVVQVSKAIATGGGIGMTMCGSGSLLEELASPEINHIHGREPPSKLGKDSSSAAEDESPVEKVIRHLESKWS